MLYQLSYLGVSRTAQGPAERAVYSGLEPSCPPGFALLRYAGRGPASASNAASTAVFGDSARGWVQSARPLGAQRRRHPQDIGESRLFRVFDVVVAARDDVGAGQPAVEVDVPAPG
jgi:hypothetical protein